MIKKIYAVRPLVGVLFCYSSVCLFSAFNYSISISPVVYIVNVDMWFWKSVYK